MAKGAFQTSREIFDNPIWADVVKFRLFFYIYGNAVFAKGGTTVADIHLKRGQFLRSYRNLANDLSYMEKRSFKNYSISTIKAKVEQLVKENRIKTEPTDYGTLFTVVNYDEYQGFERYANASSEQQPNGARTASERQPNNNKNVKNDKKKPTSDSAKKVDYKKIINFLNEKTGSKFHNVKSNQDLIRARINEGYSEHDVGLVIAVKAKQWVGNPEMEQYLRPKTLFAKTHFDEYLNEAQRSQQRRSTPEPRGLTPEEGSARSADYMAKLEERYKRGEI